MTDRALIEGEGLVTDVAVLRRNAGAVIGTLDHRAMVVNLVPLGVDRQPELREQPEGRKDQMESPKVHRCRRPSGSPKIGVFTVVYGPGRSAVKKNRPGRSGAGTG